MKSNLVTGCTGFADSDFVPYFLEKSICFHMIFANIRRYVGCLDNLAVCETLDKLHQIKQLLLIKSYNKLISFVIGRDGDNRRNATEAIRVGNRLGGSI